MKLVGFLTFAAFCCTLATALDLSSSSWIWTNELPSPGGAVSPGSRAFRRFIPAPRGKSPLLANIIITVDNGYNLFVDGNMVGAAGDFRTAQGYCVPLSSLCGTVVAVTAVNADVVPNPAGVLAAIQITYTDGTARIVVSDASWKALNSANIPTGYEQFDFDDGAWPAAVPEGSLGSAPWENINVPPSSQPILKTLTLNGSNWIWTNEIQNGTAPVGLRAFRKTFNVPNGAQATAARILIAADDDYILFVQGQVVGTKQTAYQQATNIFAPFAPTSQVTIAVAVNNTNGGPAGLITSVELDYGECLCQGNCPVYDTDYSWKYSIQGSPSHDAPIYQPGFDDSAWPSAVVEGPYGIAPWGTFPVVNA